MELTQEYFDKAIGNLLEATNDNIKKAVAPLATKEGLKARTEELKDYVQQSFEVRFVGSFGGPRRAGQEKHRLSAH